MSEATRFLVVDVNAVIRRNWEAAEGQAFGLARKRSVETVQAAAEGYDRIVACRDVPPSFRRSIFEGYKADRIDPGEAFREQLRLFVGDLRELGATVWVSPCLGEHPGLGKMYGEADDVIASFVAWYQEHRADDWSARILTSDRDLWALVDDSIGVDVLTLERKTVDVAAVVLEYGVDPPYVSETKALQGDKTDNFAGFKGIGGKTAAAILKSPIALMDGDENAADAVFRAVLAGEDPMVKLSAPQIEAIKAGGPELLKRGRQLARLVSNLVKRNDGWTGMDFAKVLLEPVRGRVTTDPVYEPKPVAPPAPATTPAEPPAPAPLALRKETTLDAPREHVAFTGRLEEAMAFAGEMYRSGLYRNLSNPAACLILTEHARAFGQPAVIVGQHAYEVSGKLAFMAQLMMSVVIAHHSTIRFRFALAMCDDQSATVRYGRRYADGEVEVGDYTYTIEMAHEAGYTTGKNAATWKKQRRAMLRWAAARECARAVWPDVTLGIRGPDEVRDGEIGDAGDFPGEMVQEEKLHE